MEGSGREEGGKGSEKSFHEMRVASMDSGEA
jgi:hypothetical protein